MQKQNWNKENIPDLSGKIIIVTGGNSGLGYESVKAFAEKGAEVILACRDLEKGKMARAEMMQTIMNGKIEVLPLDLMDLNSVKNFISLFRKNYGQLDILLNNAGIMTTPYFLTNDGFEAQLGTNHLGHFALTGQLIDLLVKTPMSRVVNVSSMAHKWGKMDFNNLQFEQGKGYSPIKAYGRSKLSNLLFTYELQRRFEKENLNSIAVAAHPGVSNTNLNRYISGKFLYKIVSPLAGSVMQTAYMGALPQIRASVDPNVKGSEYYGPDGFNEMKGYPVLVKSNQASHNTEDAKKLWEVSEKLTGVNFLI